jgi:hypothetical protein
MLKELEDELQKYLASDPCLRPFICEGSPFDCQLFIVGINPATILSKPFMTYWQPGYGFDKATWMEDYKAERSRQRSASGKRRRNALSNTRRVIEWVTEAVYPIRCLETNIISNPTPSLKELKEEVDEGKTDISILEWLIEKIHPKAVLIHGKYTMQHLWLEKPTPEFYTWDKLPNWNISAMCVPHFSRGWSEASAKQLGKRIKDEIVEDSFLAIDPRTGI